MKKTVLKRIVIVAVCVAIVAVIVALSASTIKPLNYTYGVKDGNLSLSGAGDITSVIKQSTEPYLVAENNGFALYVTNDANIVLLNKQTGKSYSTAIAQDKQSSFMDSAENMSSLLILSYLAADGTVQNMDTYTQSVSKDQYSISAIENGVEFEFLVGESSENDLIPFAVEKSRFEDDYIKKLDESDVDFLKRMYTLYDEESAANSPQEDLLTTVPALKDKSFYVRNGKISKVTTDKLKAIFKKAGYTIDDFNTDNEISGYVGDEIKPCFSVKAEVTLNDNGISLNIPSKSVRFFEQYPLLEIVPLKYLTSEVGETGGYLVPSGSGAISKFADGALSGNYVASFYGADDNATDSGKYGDMKITTDNLSFGMYAMQSANEYIMPIIDSSVENATLNISRQTTSAVAWLNFKVVQYDTSYISEKKSLIMTALDKNSSDIKVNYQIGVANTNDTVDYSLIANKYRDYLTQEGILKGETKSTPLILEYVGGVKHDTEILKLINSRGLLKLTEFDDIEAMTEPFTKIGEAGSINIKLSGWGKNGLFADAPGKFKPASSLGGKKGLKALEEYSDSISANLFYDVNHAYYYDPSSFSGFDKADSIRLIDNSLGMIYGYNSVDGKADDKKLGSYVVSPKVYKQIAEKYIAKNPTGISVGRVASVLNSDYNQQENILREDAVKKVNDMLKAYKEAKVPVLSNDCNQYALDKVDLVENVPYNPLSESKIFTQNIPFKEMVLHGTVAYTGSSLNAEADRAYTLLKAIETGSGLKYTFTSNADDRLKGTDFSYLYYTNYTTDAGAALEEWKQLNEALEGLESVKIVGHSSDGSLAKTVYENGTVIYVNYSDSDITTDNGIVKAMSYLRV